MEEIKKQYKKIIVVGMVIVGLLVLVILVQRQQLFKSRAGEEINSTLTVTNGNGSELEYVGNDTFKATSRRVIIQNKDLPY